MFWLNLSYLRCNPSHGTNQVHFFSISNKKGPKNPSNAALGPEHQASERNSQGPFAQAYFFLFNWTNDLSSIFFYLFLLKYIDHALLTEKNDASSSNPNFTHYIVVRKSNLLVFNPSNSFLHPFKPKNSLRTCRNQLNNSINLKNG